MRPDRKSVSNESFKNYFANQKNYSLDGNQAWYHNEDTGVYFVFEYQNPEPSDDSGKFHPFTFTMNYFRPSFFSQEAESEVRAFIEYFDLLVHDPQINGMGSGLYDSEKFLSGWSHGNEFGYQACLSEQQHTDTLPTQKLMQVWQWNFNRENLQNTMVDDVFVPIIFIFNYNERIITACIWGDAIPSIIPPVDVVLIGRDNLAPRKFLKKSKDFAFVPWQEIQPHLDTYKSKMHDDAYYLCYPTPPKPLAKYISSLSSFELNNMQRLSLDSVLDQELVQKYSTKI